MKILISLPVILLLMIATLSAEWMIDFENGIIVNGYNDIRIPGNTGTDFSFSEELKTKPSYFYRLKAGYTLKKKHNFILLYAPLKVYAEGQLNKDIFFLDKIFPARTHLTASYQFNSYRFTYRYDIIQNDKIIFGFGLTSKIRDALIEVKSAGQTAVKKNIGYVPILNFFLKWNILQNFGTVLEGDALAAPQGRAEDIFAGLEYNITKHLIIKGGYRILEGGANNDAVYGFTLFHYGAFGIKVLF